MMQAEKQVEEKKECLRNPESRPVQAILMKSKALYGRYIGSHKTRFRYMKRCAAEIIYVFERYIWNGLPAYDVLDRQFQAQGS
jgi:hypothetical protein